MAYVANGTSTGSGMTVQKFSKAVHSIFWTMVALGVLSVIVSIASIVAESHIVSVAGAILMAACGLAAAIWVERVDHEWQADRPSRHNQ